MRATEPPAAIAVVLNDVRDFVADRRKSHLDPDAYNSESQLHHAQRVLMQVRIGQEGSKGQPRYTADKHEAENNQGVG